MDYYLSERIYTDSTSWHQAAVLYLLKEVKYHINARQWEYCFTKQVSMRWTDLNLINEKSGFIQGELEEVRYFLNDSVLYFDEVVETNEPYLPLDSNFRVIDTINFIVSSGLADNTSFVIGERISLRKRADGKSYIMEIGPLSSIKEYVFRPDAGFTKIIYRRIGKFGPITMNRINKERYNLFLKN